MKVRIILNGKKIATIKELTAPVKVKLYRRKSGSVSIRLTEKGS